MGMLRGSFFLTGLGALLALVPACRTHAPVGAAAAVLIQFERTACMGPCPVDALLIYADGHMRYEGHEHGPRTGSFAGQLAETEKTALVQQFEKARFFEFAPTYTSSVSDRPTYYLSYSLGGRQHRVTDYDRAPAALQELEATLIKLIDDPRWQPASSTSKRD